MALSGSAYTSFHRHRLVIEWSATQSIANNNSTVTAKVYLQGMDAYSAINAPATNSGSVTVNGTTRSFTANSNLSAYQKKLLTTQTFTVGHNNDGSKSFSFSTTYNVNATLSGTFHGNKTASGTGVLNNIPRHSSLNAIPTFTIPNNSTFSITRQSSSFRHSLTFWVAKNSNPTLDNDDHWQYIKEVTNIATSGSFSFTPAEFSTMLGYMGTSTSWKGKIKLWTTGISGLSDQRYMFITPPTNSQATGGTIKLIAGQVLSGTLSNFKSDTNFSYDLTLKWGNWSKAIATNHKSSSFSYTLTQADVDTMLSYVKNAKTGTGNISTWSKYNGSRFRTEWGGQTLTGTVDEDSTKPLINKTATYADTNTASVGITGSNQAILQGQSTVEVKIPSGFATARGSATLTNISASIGGSTVSASYTGADQTLTINKPNSASNTSLVVTITDSRGFTESQSTNITVYPYSAPNVGFRVTRLNGFQEETDIRVNSTWSPVTVGGVNKNTVSSVRYRTKKTDDTVWSGYTTIPVTTTATAITSSNVRITLDNSFSWNVELSITDKLGTYTNSLEAPAGKPIMFLDAETRSVVIGALPTGKGRLELVGGEASFHAPSGVPSIYLNNGDIAGVNGIWFGPDKMDNLGEGLHFLTTAGETAGDQGNMSTVATTISYYDTIFWRDKWMYWDNKQVLGVNHTTGNLVIKAPSGGTTNVIDLQSDIDAGTQQLVTNRIRVNNSWGTFQINENLDQGIPRFVMSSSTNGRFEFQSVNNNSANFFIGSDGKPRVWGDRGIYDRTYSDAVNMFITSAGTLGRSTSASKYKLAISEVTNALDLGKNLLTLDVKRWFDKNETELYAEEMSTGQEKSADYLRTKAHFGLIAEDLRTVGLDCFTSVDPKTGEIEGIAYDRAWVVLIPVIRELNEELQMLKVKNNQISRELAVKNSISEENVK